MSRTFKLNIKRIEARMRYSAAALALISLPVSGLFGATASAAPIQKTPANVSMQSVKSEPGRQAPTVPGLMLKNALTKTKATGSNSAVNFYNWTGYVAQTSSKFTNVSTNYIQPTVTCTVPGAWTLFWVGFDGATNGTVEQAGTAAQCSNGPNPTPSYYAWWEMYPTNSIQVMPITINPGDVIAASASYSTASNSYNLTVLDASNSQYYVKTARCAANLTCANATAEWIVERPTLNGSYTPLANWNTMSLFGDRAASITSGGVQPASAFNNTPITMVSYPDQSRVLADVSALTTSSTGSAFNATWHAAQ